MYCDKYYSAALSTAEAVADTAQDSSDIPATVSAAATALLASAVLLTCSSLPHLQPTSTSADHTHYLYICAKRKTTLLNWLFFLILRARWYN